MRELNLHTFSSIHALLDGIKFWWAYGDVGSNANHPEFLESVYETLPITDEYSFFGT
jgi:hypothetical protein